MASADASAGPAPADVELAFSTVTDYIIDAPAHLMLIVEFVRSAAQQGQLGLTRADVIGLVSIKYGGDFEANLNRLKQWMCDANSVARCKAAAEWIARRTRESSGTDRAMTGRRAVARRVVIPPREEAPRRPPAPKRRQRQRRSDEEIAHVFVCDPTLLTKCADELRHQILYKNLMTADNAAGLITVMDEREFHRKLEKFRLWMSGSVERGFCVEEWLQLQQL